MREKWSKTELPREDQGQPVGHRIVLFPDTYRPKLFSKVPSMRAIDTYNSILTDNCRGYDNHSYTPDGSENAEYKSPVTPSSAASYSYDYATTASITSNNENSLYMQPYSNRNGIIYTTNSEAPYDYPTLRSTASAENSESGSKIDEYGSTAKLVNTNVFQSCRSCITYTETVLCTISLAAGLGNLYRLPQTALVRGGLPFLVAYIVLSLLVGFPLLFLELGLGQLAQEGFTKLWRAVPLFRGVGYVKFIAICLLSLYYPLYMGLFANYIIWLAHSPPPFTECASVKMTELGYKAKGIPAQECLQKTFLESPFADLKWYGILVGLVFATWAITVILLIGRTKAYVKSLVLLLLPAVACLIALIVKSVDMETKFGGFTRLSEADWSILKSANVWYYAAIQVFFSTSIGFGSFVTNAGIIFSKVNAFWTALGYIFVNLIIGVIAVILCFILSGELDPLKESGELAELHLVAVIYDTGKKYSGPDAQIWTIVTFSMLIFAGFISMVTLLYALLKAVRVETKQRWAWWKTLLVVSFTFFIIGAALLLERNFQLVHLLDHYVVGNFILICTVLEVLALATCYGSSRIQLDFEFILGKSLSKAWIYLWWLLPLILLACFIWAFATVSLTGIWVKDPMWLYGTGWSIVLTALIFIIVMAFYQIFKQDEYYTFKDKIVAVIKPLRKWGPVDPIMRYGWVQWHSKAKDGERDFTLKRRGTKDYTHSVKKRRPNATSNTSTLSREYNNNHNQNKYAEPLRIHVRSPYSDDSNMYEKPLRVTSLVDTLDPPNFGYLNRNTFPGDQKTAPVVPLNTFNEQNDGSTSEGYGTFRKGPYIISDDQIEHVCHRKYSNEHEISTEL